MPKEVENALRAAAEKVVPYVEDAVELKVQTGYIQVGSDTTDHGIKN
jgi:hypothetical protein